MNKCLKKIPDSIEELHSLIDEQYEQIAEEYRQAGVEKNRLAEEIDAVLKERRPEMFEQLKKIVSSGSFQKTQECDDELITFARVLSIYEEEKNADKTPLLERVTSVAELQEIYVRTFFGMRRLEVGMPKQSQDEFLRLILQYDMSAIYLANVWKWHGFYNLDYLLERFTEMLQENGMETLSEEIYEQVATLAK